jgi:FkbM family methyltransferase
VYDTGLETERVRRIVDVGGNVGYSLVFWCLSYPHARILTYEPHPLHCEIIRWHLDANGLSDRVTVLQAGAAVKSSSEVLLGVATLRLLNKATQRRSSSKTFNLERAMSLW